MMDALRDLSGVDVLRFNRSSALATADHLQAQEVSDHNQARAWLAVLPTMQN